MTELIANTMRGVVLFAGERIATTTIEHLWLRPAAESEGKKSAGVSTFLMSIGNRNQGTQEEQKQELSEETNFYASVGLARLAFVKLLVVAPLAYLSFVSEADTKGWALPLAGALSLGSLLDLRKSYSLSSQLGLINWFRLVTGL